MWTALPKGRGNGEVCSLPDGTSGSMHVNDVPSIRAIAQYCSLKAKGGVMSKAKPERSAIRAGLCRRYNSTGKMCQG